MLPLLTNKNTTMKDKNGTLIREHSLIKYHVSDTEHVIYKVVKTDKGKLILRTGSGDSQTFKKDWKVRIDTARSLVVFDPNIYGKRVCESSCCDGWSTSFESVDGVCEECGGPTSEGSSASGCNYSPCACKKCGWRPCDLSC